MKPFDFNKFYSFSALKQQLNIILHKQESAFAFKISNGHPKTVKDPMSILRQEEEQFADFFIRKQKEIDKMEHGFLKSKMQQYLDYVVLNTCEHYSMLKAKYKYTIKGEIKKKYKFTYSEN